MVANVVITQKRNDAGVTNAYCVCLLLATLWFFIVFNSFDSKEPFYLPNFF